MSLEYLASIGNAHFPLVVRTVRDIDNIRLLKAAEMVTASVSPAALNAVDDEEAQAVVFGLTERGELALRAAQMPPESPLRRGHDDLLDA